MLTRIRLMIFSIAVFALGATLIVHGIQSVDAARRFARPETITLEQLIERQPKEGWYRVEEGVLSVFHAAWRAKRQPGPQGPEVQVMYVPFLYRDQTPNLTNDPTEKHPLYVVVRTRDADLRDTVENLHRMAAEQAESGEDWMAANRNRVLVERVVEGTVRRANAIDAFSLSRLWGTVDPNCLILEEGGKPASGSGASREIGFGVFLILGLPLLWLLVSRISDRPDGVVGDVSPALLFSGGTNPTADDQMVMPGTPAPPDRTRR
jgi:hypothetical protein